MLLEALRDSPKPPKLYVITAGAGAKFINELWSVPGASAYLAGAEMPYATNVTDKLIGFTPNHYVTAEVAHRLAHSAYRKAVRAAMVGDILPADHPPLIGIGATAAVTGLTERRGSNRMFAVAVTDTQVFELFVDFGKRGVEYPGLSRMKDDLDVHCALTDLLAVAAGTSTLQESNAGDRHSFYQGTFSMVEPTNPTEHFWRAQEEDLAWNDEEIVFVPGMFNPPHLGHLTLAQAAGKTSGRQPVFYITCTPPHKGSLSLQDILIRQEYMADMPYPTVFSQGDPLFIDKARKHPGAHFAIGADTFDRMLDPKWGPVEPMIAEFRSLGTRFYVAPRVVDGKLMNCGDVCAKWNTYDWVFEHLPRFEAVDISSSNIRKSS